LIQLVGLQEQEWELFKQGLQQVSYPPQTEIISHNKTAKHLYFIQSGILRSYYIINGREVNTYFACDHQFISTFASFVSQQPSQEYLETVTASTVYKISYSFLHNLYEQPPVLNV